MLISILKELKDNFAHHKATFVLFACGTSGNELDSALKTVNPNYKESFYEIEQLKHC